MTRIVAMIMALALLSACGDTGNDGENPLDREDEAGEAPDDGADGGEDGDGADGDGAGDTPIDSDGDLPPGTAQPTPDGSIVRYEPRNDAGGGYAESISYDAATDTFEVDNLAFDGDNTYRRGGQPDSQNAVGQLGPFAVYESDVTSVDPVTGNVVDNLAYRAIYGVSDSGATEFAIVRTGDYINFGFGGFVYQRNATDAAGNSTALELPTEGDAAYAGDYAGVRIFDGTTGLDYTTGDATMQIDFKDFNDSQAGVSLTVANRRLYDINGTDITDRYIAALQEQNEGFQPETDGAGNAVLPSINSTVTPDVADSNGEIVQSIFTTISVDGATQTAEEGQYYAVMSGENADEIVGVLVLGGDDALRETAFQETGGFIVYRQ